MDILEKIRTENWGPIFWRFSRNLKLRQFRKEFLRAEKMKSLYEKSICFFTKFVKKRDL